MPFGAERVYEYTSNTESAHLSHKLASGFRTQTETPSPPLWNASNALLRTIVSDQLAFS